MNQIITKHMESDGSAINLDLGFVPSFALVINAAATSTEAMILGWFGSEMGDGKEFQITAAGVPSYASSGGYISAYNSKTVDTGTTDDDDDPVRVAGFKGITIGANFSDDSDEIWVLAIKSDVDLDEGDINA